MYTFPGISSVNHTKPASSTVFLISVEGNILSLFKLRT